MTKTTPTMRMAMLAFKAALKKEEAGDLAGADNYLEKAANYEAAAYANGERHGDDVTLTVAA